MIPASNQSFTTYDAPAQPNPFAQMIQGGLAVKFAKKQAEDEWNQKLALSVLPQLASTQQLRATQPGEPGMSFGNGPNAFNVPNFMQTTQPVSEQDAARTALLKAQAQTEGMESGMVPWSDAFIKNKAASVVTEAKYKPDYAYNFTMWKKMKGNAKKTMDDFDNENYVNAYMMFNKGNPNVSGQGTPSVAVPKTTTMAEIEAVAKKNGRPVQEIMEGAKAKGYTIVGVTKTATAKANPLPKSTPTQSQYAPWQKSNSFFGSIGDSIFGNTPAVQEYRKKYGTE